MCPHTNKIICIAGQLTFPLPGGFASITSTELKQKLQPILKMAVDAKIQLIKDLYDHYYAGIFSKLPTDEPGSIQHKILSFLCDNNQMNRVQLLNKEGVMTEMLLPLANYIPMYHSVRVSKAFLLEEACNAASNVYKRRVAVAAGQGN